MNGYKLGGLGNSFNNSLFILEQIKQWASYMTRELYQVSHSESSHSPYSTELTLGTFLQRCFDLQIV